MKHLIEKAVRLRNPAFRFDDGATPGMVRAFFFAQLRALLRGRKLLLRGRSPKWMMMGRRVELQHLGGIRWGRFVKLGDNVCLSAFGRNGVQLGHRVGIGAGSRIIAATTLDNLGDGIRIGNNVGIGEFAYLGGAGGLSIGDDCIIGQYFSCHSENHVCDDLDVLIRHQSVTRKGIRIGGNCWIGSKVTILDGVTLGEGCVIAAGAVVTRSFPANSVIGGVPAKVLRERGGTHIGSAPAPVKTSAA